MTYAEWVTTLYYTFEILQLFFLRQNFACCNNFIHIWDDASLLGVKQY